MEGDQQPQPPSVLYQYVLVRKDLPPERQLVDVGHACGESIQPGQPPVPDNKRLVALHVRDEAELLEYHRLAESKGLPCRLVREPDPPYGGQAMSLGLAPDPRRSKLRKLFHHLELVDFQLADLVRHYLDQASGLAVSAIRGMLAQSEPELRLVDLQACVDGACDVVAARSRLELQPARTGEQDGEGQP